MDDRELRRLHPSSLIFSIGGAARRLLLPGLIVLFAAVRGGAGYELFAMLMFFPAIAVAVVKYLSFRYRFGDGELVIREGIITRNERHIPYQRIQNIDQIQNPLQRMLNVAEVRLETAGGDEPEAAIRVLSLASIGEMRKHVFAERELERVVEASTEPGGQLLHRLTLRDVVLFGVISNQGMVVVAALIGLSWQFVRPDDWSDRLSKETFQSLPGFSLTSPVVAVLFLIAFLIAVLVLLRAFSISWALLRFTGFTLRRKGDDLRAEYGLLTRRTKSVPRQRVQLVSSYATVLHRRFGRVAVQVETAGGSTAESSSTADKIWLAPIIRRVELAGLMREALPGLDLDALDWQPLAPRAFRRLLRRSLIVAAVPSVAAIAALGLWGLVVPAITVPWAWLHARLYVRHTAFAVTSDSVVYRSGWWVRRLSAARINKIQALELVESPFDRRNDMAELRLDTAGSGPVGHGIAIAFLDAPAAVNLHERLSVEAGRTAFRW